MDIEFRGEVTKAEFLRAVRMTLRLPKRETTIRVFGAVLVAVIVTAAIIYDQIMNGMGSDRVLSMVLSLLMIELAFLYPFINILESERRVTKPLDARTYMAGTINNRGISILNPIRRWENAWGDFYRVRQSEDLIGLMAPDGTIWVLSRGLFSTESEWRTVKTWAQSLVQEAK